PIDWLSGLQNGLRAPSVPRSGRGSIAASDRTHSDDPDFEFAMKATCRPSGDTANSTCGFVNFEPSGGRIGNSTSAGAASGGPRRLSSIVPPSATASAAATIQPRRSRARYHRPGAAAVADLVDETGV